MYTFRFHLPSWHFFLLIAWLCGFTHALVQTNGTCSLAVFVDFTYNGTAQSDSNFAFSHFASAMMAIEDFNNRDSSVIPELADPLYQECNFKFDQDSWWNGKSRVIDSSTFGKNAVQHLFQYTKDYGEPCAMVGSFSDYPVQGISSFASAMETPFVTYCSRNIEFSISYLHDYVSQTNPLIASSLFPMVAYLRTELGRTQYHAILYSANQRESLTQAKMLQRVLNSQGILSVMYGYSKATGIKIYGSVEGADSLWNTTERIKESGFRTILVVGDNAIPTSPRIRETVRELANVAEHFKMNNGDYFWAFFGGISHENIWESNNDTLIWKLFRGSLLFDFIEPFYVDGEDDKFLKHWRNQGTEMIHILNKTIPMDEGEPGFFRPPQDYFQTVTPSYGSAFMYDSVMSIGIGACIKAEDQGRNGDTANISGFDHLQGLRKSNFMGASGQMRFTEASIGVGNGVREFPTGMYAAYNIYPPDAGVTYRLTALLDPMENSVTVSRNSSIDDELDKDWNWIIVNDFKFTLGQTKENIPLIDESFYNYIPQSCQILGLTLFGISVVIIICMIIWIAVKRNHPVLRAAQPITLLFLNVGALLIVSIIPMVSFDESNNISEVTLGRMCLSGPWLYVTGAYFVYGAIFVKLARVNKVLKFTRKRVSWKQICYPVIALFAVAVVLLIVWTVMDFHQWDREVVNETSESAGQSFGKCTSKGPIWLLVIMIIVTILPMLLALAAAWKTRDVEDSFSESSWIFAMMFVNCQLLIILIPIMWVLTNVNTVGYYLCLVFLSWTGAMTCVLMIMLPKMLAYFGLHGGEAVQKRGPSSTQNTKSGENRLKTTYNI